MPDVAGKQLAVERQTGDPAVDIGQIDNSAGRIGHVGKPTECVVSVPGDQNKTAGFLTLFHDSAVKVIRPSDHSGCIRNRTQAACGVLSIVVDVCRILQPHANQNTKKSLTG